MRRKPSAPPAAASLDCCYHAVAIALSWRSFLPFSLGSSHSPLNLLQLSCPPATGFWFGFVEVPHSFSGRMQQLKRCTHQTGMGADFQPGPSASALPAEAMQQQLHFEKIQGVRAADRSRERENWTNTWCKSSSWPRSLGELTRMPCSCIQLRMGGEKGILGSYCFQLPTNTASCQLNSSQQRQKAGPAQHTAHKFPDFLHAFPSPNTRKVQWKTWEREGGVMPRSPCDTDLTTHPTRTVTEHKTLPYPWKLHTSSDLLPKKTNIHGCHFK